METPDKIKKVLEHCVKTGMKCGMCNYEIRCLKVVRGKPVMQDALALIQQLEAANAEKDKRIAELEKERDAAVRDISRGSRCSVCKKFFKNNGNVGCSGGVYCIPLDFEWQGVCPENTEVQE